jgi:diguanylate cyclase
MVSALVRAIELKDLSTAAHTWRVVLYTRALAEEAGLSHERIAHLTSAAALHDLGKIDVPDAVLQKPGPLTPEERAIMQTHAALGHERLIRMGEDDPDVLALVRSHHERLDGAGYPDALTSEAIPMPARYFAVIDSFDAMTSIRPYRDQTGIRAAEHAIEELHAGSGTHYWPDGVALLDRLYRAGRLAWILEYFNDSCPVNYEGNDGLDAVLRSLKR